MKKTITIAILLALGLAACSGGGSKPVTAKAAAKNAKPYVPPKTSPTPPKATTSTTPAKPADAVALAARLGCENPKPEASETTLDFGPKATASVECPLPDGTTITVTTYAPAGVKALKGPIMQSAICELATGFGATPPFFTVYGYDFNVDVIDDVEKPMTTAEYRAKAQALADALDLPLTTIECKGN